MEINEFIEQLKLPNQITNKALSNSEDEVIYDLLNSDIFSKIYSILDKSSLVDLDYDDLEITDTGSHMVYLSDDYDIILESNFDNDDYTLTIEKVK